MMLVDEYGTRQLHTRIFRVGEAGFLWQRRRLTARTAASLVAEIAGSERMRSAGSVVVGVRDGDTVSYAVPGAKSLARIIWPPSASAVGFPVTTITGAIGCALRYIATYDDAFPRPQTLPPALTRLDYWLHDGSQEEGAARLHRLCTSRLGPNRMRMLRAWCDTSSERNVLLHGEPSLGMIVPTPDGSHSVLLTGESLSQGPVEYDVGWLLGELAEMADVARRNLPPGSSAIPFGAMAQSLLDARGGALDAALLGRFATLRRMAHVVDFATYVAWNEGVATYVDTLATLIDDTDDYGRAALAPLGPLGTPRRTATKAPSVDDGEAAQTGPSPTPR